MFTKVQELRIFVHSWNYKHYFIVLTARCRSLKRYCSNWPQSDLSKWKTMSRALETLFVIRRPTTAALSMTLDPLWLVILYESFLSFVVFDVEPGAHYFICFTVEWFHMIRCKHLHNHFTSKFTEYAQQVRRVSGFDLEFKPGPAWTSEWIRIISCRSLWWEVDILLVYNVLYCNCWRFTLQPILHEPALHNRMKIPFVNWEWLKH